MNKMTVRDISLESKHVLMRVDFNVPMANGVVTDDKRIKAALPTIQYVIDQGASLVLMSHLGRPKGTGFEPDFSLKAASEALAKLLGKPVQMAPDCVGPDVEAMAKALEPGDVLMLENTRFHKGEEKNDLDLARQMAALGDVFVNDAFGSAHRAHASTEGVARSCRPSPASSWSRSWSTWAAPQTTRRIPTSPSSGEPRSATRSP